MKNQTSTNEDTIEVDTGERQRNVTVEDVQRLAVIQYKSQQNDRVKVLKDALHEILDQVSEHTGPMPMMVREIAKQALGEGEDE